MRLTKNQSCKLNLATPCVPSHKNPGHGVAHFSEPPCRSWRRAYIDFQLFVCSVLSTDFTTPQPYVRVGTPVPPTTPTAPHTVNVAPTLRFNGSIGVVRSDGCGGYSPSLRETNRSLFLLTLPHLGKNIELPDVCVDKAPGPTLITTVHDVLIFMIPVCAWCLTSGNVPHMFLTPRCGPLFKSLKACTRTMRALIYSSSMGAYRSRPWPNHRGITLLEPRRTFSFPLMF